MFPAPALRACGAQDAFTLTANETASSTTVKSEIKRRSVTNSNRSIFGAEYYPVLKEKVYVSHYYDSPIGAQQASTFRGVHYPDIM